MKPRRVEPTRDDYATEVGDEALDRQQAEAAVRFDCCGELRAGGHHPMCRRFEPDGPAEVHPDQESLL